MISNINFKPLRTFRDIEQYFRGTRNLYQLRPNQGNYDKLSNAELIKDGWRQVVQPEFNPDTQRLGALVYDKTNDVVTREVISKTQEEIDIDNQVRLDSDSSAQKFEEDRQKGIQFFDRFLKFMQREVDKGRLTQNQADNADDILFDALLPCSYGKFKISQKRLNAIQEPSNAKLKALLDKAKQQVSDLIT